MRILLIETLDSCPFREPWQSGLPGENRQYCSYERRMCHADRRPPRCPLDYVTADNMRIIKSILKEKP